MDGTPDDSRPRVNNQPPSCDDIVCHDVVLTDRRR